MSDYLDNLTAKAVNPMQAIQPRLASIFEPTSAAGRPMAARRSTNGESAPGEPFSGGSAIEGPLLTQKSFSHAWQSRPPTTDLGRPHVPLSQPTGMTETSMDQPPGHWVQTSAASSSSGAARPLDEKTAQASHPDTPILEQIIGRAVGERAVLSDVPQSGSITHPESVSDQARRASTPAMTVGQPHVTLYHEPPVSIPSEVTARPEPAPTIKITIGRVDVRAIMPATPAPRSTPTRPSPALSLEDYLRQRGGGRP